MSGYDELDALVQDPHRAGDAVLGDAVRAIRGLRDQPGPKPSPALAAFLGETSVAACLSDNDDLPGVIERPAHAPAPRPVAAAQRGDAA